MVLFMLIATFSGCNFADNNDASKNDVVSSEQTGDVTADADADSESESIVDPTIDSEETSVIIEYFTPTKYGTGLEFKLPALEGCSDDSVLIQELTYGCNRLLYGIGSLAGRYEVKDYFMAPEFITYTKDYGHDEEGNLMTVYLELRYEIRTADEKTVTVTVESELGCDANGVFGGQPLGTWFLVEIPDSPYYYTAYDSIEFYEILIGNEVAEGHYNIDTGDWTAIKTNNPDENNTSPSLDALSDSALEYEALTYLVQIASEIKYEYRDNGYKKCQASPHAAFTSVINRTNDMVLIQGRIDVWLDGGGDPDGNITVTLMMDPYDGDLIDYYFK